MSHTAMLVNAPEVTDWIAATQAMLRKLTFHDPDPDTDLLATGLLDSVTLVQLLAELEEQFELGISMDEVGVESFRSIASIARLMAAKQAAKAAAPTSPVPPSLEPREPVALVYEVQALIQDTFSVRVESVDQDLFDSGVVDSLILVQLILRLEERFELDLVMQNLDLNSFSTVRTIAEFLGTCFRNNGRPAL